MIDTPPAFAEIEFRKSSWSVPDKDCVHVARRVGWVAVRDSKVPFGGSGDQHLVFAADRFDGFLTSRG
jgi:hypothetical protein